MQLHSVSLSLEKASGAHIIPFHDAPFLMLMVEHLVKGNLKKTMKNKNVST